MSKEGAILFRWNQKPIYICNVLDSEQWGISNYMYLD